MEKKGGKKYTLKKYSPPTFTMDIETKILPSPINDGGGLGWGKICWAETREKKEYFEKKFAQNDRKFPFSTFNFPFINSINANNLP